VSGILDGLRKDVNSILGLRDSLGVAKASVFLITRTYAKEIGDGEYVEEKVQMLPTPYVFVFTADRKIPEGGVIKQGDIILKNVSMQSYPTEDLIDNSSTEQNVEKLYEVDGNLYRCIEVTKKHITWKLTLRRLSK